MERQKVKKLAKSCPREGSDLNLQKEGNNLSLNMKTKMLVHSNIRLLQNFNKLMQFYTTSIAEILELSWHMVTWVLKPLTNQYNCRNVWKLKYYENSRDVIVLSTILYCRNEGWCSSTFPILCKEAADLSLQRGSLPSEMYVLLTDTTLPYGINSSLQVCERQLSL